MPQAARFEYTGALLRVEPITDATGPIRLVWLHGWGQSRESFRPLANSLIDIGGESWLVDLPGHGEAPPPPSAYAPADYAALLTAWLATLPPCPTVLIGHSLGFRVAVHTAFTNPQMVTALASLAGAGVPRALTVKEAARRKYIRLLMKFAHLIKPFLGEGTLNALRRRFGSRDYLSVSAEMKPTFIRVVNDNVTALCRHIQSPVLLVYGEADTETPPSVAHRFKHLFPRAQLVMLPHQTHYSLLQGGRTLAEKHLRAFLQQRLK
ncbi:MAG: alpha/beta fold hydrolase [Proteobacteria bacterium]|nr:alpha/beta fold hydrolase [Pseudomonadota bacterium]